MHPSLLIETHCSHVLIHVVAHQGVTGPLMGTTFTGALVTVLRRVPQAFFWWRLHAGTGCKLDGVRESHFWRFQQKIDKLPVPEVASRAKNANKVSHPKSECHRREVGYAARSLVKAATLLIRCCSLYLIVLSCLVSFLFGCSEVSARI